MAKDIDTKLPTRRIIDATHTSSLRKSYYKELWGLFKNFRDSVIPIVKGIWGSTGILRAMDSAIDDITIITIYSELPTIVKTRITQAYIAGKKRAVSNPRLKRNNITISFALNRLDQLVIEDLRARNFNLVRGATETMKADMLRVISDGIRQQQSTQKIARNLRKTVNKIGKNRSKLIARTEIAYSYNNAISKTYQEAGIKKWQWLAAMGERTCPICEAKHGQIFRWGDEQPPVHPRCYDRDTEIYTSEGWKYIYKIKKGEKCLSLNPKTFDLEYVPVKNTIESFEKQMLHFHNRTFDTMVTFNHNMFYQTDWNSKYNKSVWKFVEAEKLLNITCGRFYRSSKWKGKNPKSVKFADTKIPIHLYAKFMGWYLSEGCTVESRNLVYIAQDRDKNPEKWEMIQELLDEIGLKYYSQKSGFGITNKILCDQLKTFGKANEKYIPEVIKNATPEIIKEFIETYRLGDGYIKKAKKWKDGNFEPSIIYCTSSKRMADDIGELILKIHKRPSFRLERKKGLLHKFRNGTYRINNDVWIISECNAQYARMDSMNVDIVEYNDYAYCIELEKYHTLYVRRNGKVYWSGNCLCTIYPIIEK
jgi:SPP1 gp7 family putative phage head morphogenesis protein